MHPERAQAIAAGALRNLSGHDSCVVAIAAEGGIRPLIAALASPSLDLQTGAAGVPAAMSANRELAAQIVGAGGAAPLARLAAAAGSAEGSAEAEVGEAQRLARVALANTGNE